MEILRSGKNLYKHTCTKCDCIFAYSKLDVKVVADHPNSYMNALYCPECLAEQVVYFQKRYSSEQAKGE